MRVLAVILGITIAAVIVSVLAAAEPETHTSGAEKLAPEPQTTRADASPNGFHLAAAVAGLTALIIVAPMAGRF